MQWLVQQENVDVNCLDRHQKTPLEVRHSCRLRQGGGGTLTAVLSCSFSIQSWQMQHASLELRRTQQIATCVHLNRATPAAPVLLTAILSACGNAGGSTQRSHGSGEAADGQGGVRV